MVDDVRDRVHEALLACAGRSAFRFSVEDVARQAGVSRATVYRLFPGGKEQLIRDGVAWEVARFFGRVSAEVEQVEGFEAKLERALVVGRHLLEEHAVLHQILRRDPEQLLARLEGALDPVVDAIQGYVASLLRREQLAPGVEVDEAAEYLARLYLSYLGHQGAFDVDDPAQRRYLVRTQFIGGVLAGRTP